jgi:type II secretory pathway component PulF
MLVALTATVASLILVIVLLWRYVPTQAEHMACSQHTLPLLTNVVLFVASWFFRLLPFAIIFGGPVVLVLGIIVAGVFIKARGRRSFVRRLTLLATIATCVALGCSGVIVYAMRAGIRSIDTECLTSLGQ